MVKLRSSKAVSSVRFRPAAPPAPADIARNEFAVLSAESPSLEQCAMSDPAHDGDIGRSIWQQAQIPGLTQIDIGKHRHRHKAASRTCGSTHVTHFPVFLKERRT